MSSERYKEQAAQIFYFLSVLADFPRRMFRSLPTASSPAKFASASAQSEAADELCCFLCKNMFNEPLILSCGHSFCRHCIQPWLRRATVCPFCRCPTLPPIPNTTITQKVAEFKRIDSSGKSNFIRNALRRTIHSSKEARMLQREAMRASQRRPKNVVLPERAEDANLEADATKEMGQQQQQFSRMGNLRKSFLRIKNKYAQQMDDDANANANKCRVSVHSFRSATTGSAIGPLQTEIRRAFSVHLDNARHIELTEGKESPAELTVEIGIAQRIVLVCRIDQRESFECIQKMFEYYSPKAINTMKGKKKFVLLGLIISQKTREVDRMSGEKLADLLGTRFCEIELAVLEKTFPIWFHSPRPNLASIESSLRPPGASVGGPSRRLPATALPPRPLIQLVSPQRSISDDFRPAMGLSGSAIRRSELANPKTALLLERPEEQQKKRKKKNAEEMEKGGQRVGGGCVVM
uniref:RING-type domain-containing protein n=1 Tax=Globodera rostochiensis TaxID=31243 RepID=A0A914HK25_GLORO